MSGAEREQGQGPAPQPRGGGERGVARSARHAHEQGPPANSGAGVTEAGSGRARGAEQRSGERGGPVGWAPSRRERGRVGHTWNTWASRGEGKNGSGPKEQEGFRFIQINFN
jgi:hypothetical protein